MANSPSEAPHADLPVTSNDDDLVIYEDDNYSITRKTLVDDPGLVDWIINQADKAGGSTTGWDFKTYKAKLTSEANPQSASNSEENQLQASGDNTKHTNVTALATSRSAAKRQRRKARKTDAARSDYAETLLDAEHPLWDSFRTFVGKEATKTGHHEVDERTWTQPPTYSVTERRRMMETMEASIRANPDYLVRMRAFQEQLASTQSNVADKCQAWKSVPGFVRSYCTALKSSQVDMRQLRADSWNAIRSSPDFASFSEKDRSRLDAIMHPDSSAKARSEARSQLNDVLGPMADRILSMMDKLLPIEVEVNVNAVSR